MFEQFFPRRNSLLFLDFSSAEMTKLKEQFFQVLDNIIWQIKLMVGLDYIVEKSNLLSIFRNGKIKNIFVYIFYNYVYEYTF